VVLPVDLKPKEPFVGNPWHLAMALVPRHTYAKALFFLAT